MAYARQRGKYWSGRWRDTDGRLAEEGGFPDKASALAHAKDMEYLVRKGKKTRPSDMNLTVTQFINKVWLPTLKVTEGTAQDYEYSLNGSILPKFGNKPMRDIKPHDIESWVVELTSSGKLSDRTIEKRRNLLAQILKKAVQNEYLDKSPFSKLTFTKAKKVNKVIPLTHGQVTALANSLTPRFRIMVWIGYYTGMRPSEILGVTWDRLNFDNETILVDRQISRKLSEVHAPQGLKTENSERTIGFSKDLQILIKEHVDTFGLGPEGLILQTNGGKVFRYKGAIEMFRVAARTVGLRVGEGLHQLRHTCVSVLIAEGANPKEIQEWVGHASIEETMDTYGHLFPNAKHQLSSMLDSYAKRHAEVAPLSLAN
jgi:integrase